MLMISMEKNLEQISYLGTAHAVSDKTGTWVKKMQ